MEYNENPVEIVGERIEDKSKKIEFETNDDLSDKRSTLEENNKSSIEKNNLSRKKHPIIMILEFMIILIFIQFCITHAGSVLSDLLSKIN